jgi:hypothetical protein
MERLSMLLVQLKCFHTECAILVNHIIGEQTTIFLFYSFLFYMSLIVCEVSVGCQDMSPIILRCLYPDVQYLLQVGVAGSALPTHQCFSHAGSGKILPMPLYSHALQYSPMSLPN